MLTKRICWATRKKKHSNNKCFIINNKVVGSSIKLATDPVWLQVQTKLLLQYCVSQQRTVDRMCMYI